MSIYKKSLYAKDQHGNIREWSIEAHVGLTSGVLLISHGTIDGEKTESFEEIPEGLAGRSIEDQTLSRFNSRIKGKINSGYVEDVETAINFKRVNILGFLRPMLAAKYKDLKSSIPFLSGVHIQRKYDGFRCLIKNHNGEIFAYSRNGKLIGAIDHITSKIEIPNGMTLDGELYYHGEYFQTISSWIKKKQPETKKIKYIVYDLISECVYSERLNMLKEIDCLFNNDSISIAETDVVYSDSDALEKLHQYISEGYEGAILRISKSKYEDGKRSKSLVKLKVYDDNSTKSDDEFLVIDITPSSEDWAILTCLAHNGSKFSASAPGTKYEKTQILKNKDKYLNRMVNVEYSGFTKDGKPFHPIAKFFRDKSSE